MRLNLKIAILKSHFRTQRRFAQALGKNDNWVSLFVRGHREPSESEKRLISYALGLEFSDDLFSDV